MTSYMQVTHIHTPTAFRHIHVLVRIGRKRSRRILRKQNMLPLYGCVKRMGGTIRICAYFIKENVLMLLETLKAGEERKYQLTSFK